MKFNKNNIVRLAKLASMLLVACLFVSSIVSCSDDDEEVGNPYIKLGVREKVAGVDEDILVADDYELNTTRGGISSVAYFIFTNLGDWELRTEKAADASWIDLWPNTGNKDGRFYVKVASNKTFEPRTAKINIVSNGTVHRSFLVNQEAGVEEIWFTPSALTIGYEGRPLLLTVESNTKGGWIATSNAEWAKVTRQTDNQIVMQVEEHTYIKDGKQRTATITATSMDNPNLKATFTLKQNLQPEPLDN